ncbi:MAG: CopG family transcriptional regulator [Massilioclostridium sp.]|nr:CopG family transcriptional regulator [Massilioclostridium sp.]
MSPRTGRPPTANPKNVKMNIRITEETAKDLQECADKLNISRIGVIEKGIQLVKAELKK